MSHGSGELIAITRGQWWIRRSLGLFGILCVVAGMALVVQGWLNPETDLTDRQVILFGVVFVIGLVYLVPSTFRINRLGVFLGGVAPPMKPLWALHREPFIASWTEIERVELEPRRDPSNPPSRYSVALVLNKGRPVRFSSAIVGGRFRSDSAKRRFYALLSLLTDLEGRPIAAPVDSSDTRIASVLSTSWPESGAYRRTLASKVGMAVGGPVGLFSTIVTILHVDDSHMQVWRGMFILGFFVFIWSALTRNLFRGIAPRKRLGTRGPAR